MSKLQKATDQVIAAWATAQDVEQGRVRALLVRSPFRHTIAGDADPGWTCVILTTKHPGESIFANDGSVQHEVSFQSVTCETEELALLAAIKDCHRQIVEKKRASLQRTAALETALCLLEAK